MCPFPTDDITQILLNSSPPSPPFHMCARLLWMQEQSIHTPSRFSSEQYLVTYFGGDILYWSKAIDRSQQNSESFDNFSSWRSLVFFLKHHHLPVALFQELNHKKFLVQPCCSFLILPLRDCKGCAPEDQTT